MNKLILLITISSILALYIIFTWIYRQLKVPQKSYAFTTGCFSEETLVESPILIKDKFQKLKQQQVSLNKFIGSNLYKYDGLLQKISQKLYVFESAYYISKQKHQNYFWLHQKLQQSINQYQSCKKRMQNQNSQTCFNLTEEKSKLRSNIQGTTKELQRLNKEKKKLEEDFKVELNYVSGNRIQFTRLQLQIKKQSEKVQEQINQATAAKSEKEKQLANAASKFAKILQQIQKCANSNKTAAVCRQINSNLQTITNKEKNLAQTSKRVDSKQKQIQSLINAIQASSMNTQDRKRLQKIINQTKKQYKELLNIYIQLRVKQSECNQLCSEEKKNQLNNDRYDISYMMINLRQQLATIQKFLEQSEQKKKILLLKWQNELKVNQCKDENCKSYEITSLSQIVDKIIKNSNEIKQQNNNYKNYLQNVTNLQERIGKQQKNLQILNECSIKRKIVSNLKGQMQKLQKQNKIKISFEDTHQPLRELIKLVNQIKLQIQN